MDNSGKPPKMGILVSSGPRKMTRETARQVAEHANKPVAVPARPVATPAKPVATPVAEPAAKPVATPASSSPTKPVATPAGPQPAKPVATPAFPTPPQPHVARPVPGYKQNDPLPLAWPKAPSLMGSVPENLRHHTTAPEPANLRIPDRPSAVPPTTPQAPEYPPRASFPTPAMPSGGPAPAVPNADPKTDALLSAINSLSDRVAAMSQQTPQGRGAPADRSMTEGASVWEAPADDYTGGARSAPIASTHPLAIDSANLEVDW